MIDFKAVFRQTFEWLLPFILAAIVVTFEVLFTDVFKKTEIPETQIEETHEINQSFC